MLFNIEPLRMWVHKVLPVVYDDSLSYYEVLAKTVKKLNEVIDLTDEQTKFIQEFSDNLTDAINEWEEGLTGEWTEYKEKINTEWENYKSNTDADIELWKHLKEIEIERAVAEGIYAFAEYFEGIKNQAVDAADRAGDEADRAEAAADEAAENAVEAVMPTLEGIFDNRYAFKSAIGSPLVAQTAANMTDTNRIYVYVGDETGYVNGNWYYYDGTAWESGGVYNSVAVVTDTTLSEAGVPADAKAAGDEITDLKRALNEGAKTLLINNSSTYTIVTGSYWKSDISGFSSDSKRARTNSFNKGNLCGLAIFGNTYQYKIALLDSSKDLIRWLNSDYTNGVTYLPKDGDYLLMNFKRTDNADIATSESSDIQSALQKLYATDTELILSSYPADAKAVGDKFVKISLSVANQLDALYGETINADILEGGIYSSNPDGTKNFRLFNNGTSAIFNSITGRKYHVKVNGFTPTIFRVYGRKDIIEPEDITTNNMIVSVIYEAPSPISEYIIDAQEYKTIFLYLSGSTSPAQGMTVTARPFAFTEIDDSKALQGKTWSSNKIKGMLSGLSNFEYHSISAEDACTSDVALGSDAFLDATYETLRLAHPEYITRSVLGKDASGLYDIYKYEFTPDYYDQIVYVQAGVHPWEPDGYVALYRVLKHIVNDWLGDKNLIYLRWGVKIVCVPIVNVWGTYQPEADRTDKNYNGVDLNTDCIAKTQAETIAVTGLIDSIVENPLFSFGIDFHTTYNWTYGDYLLTVWTGSLNEFAAKQTLYMLDRKNCTERTEAYLNNYDLEPTELRIIRAGDSTAVRTYCAYIRDKGFPSATVEHSDEVWGAKHSSAAMTKAVENYINQLINHTNGKYCRILGS